MSLVIAGTSSGSGKSTVTMGILAALRRAGITVQPFKAGPDFIDPGLHTLVTGCISRNLDLFICGAEYVRQCMAKHSAGADAAIIEGVMGLFDGGERSTAALSHATGAKVLLVLDAYGMAESAGAMLKGFDEYGKGIDAVIFNRVGSARHYDRLKDAVPKGIMSLGYLPRDTAFTIPERHLGLTIAEENPLGADALNALADAVDEHIDMDAIKEMARPDDTPVTVEVNVSEPTVTIAVARDRAFCFYYEDNFDLLKGAGARLKPFSPIADSALPGGIDAVYIGGGYPELNAQTLSENTSMLRSIRDWSHGGRPLYAECGGLMYLGDELTAGGKTYPMAGALPIKSSLMQRRAALGYRSVSMAGIKLRGHEFHYSSITEHDSSAGMEVNVMGEDGPEISSLKYKDTLASYTHLHLGSAPDAAGKIINHIKRENA